MAQKKKIPADGNTSDKENGGLISTRCAWTDTDDAILVRVLTEQKQLGNSSDNGFKKPVWVTVAAALAAESPKNDPSKIASKCQDHWSNMSTFSLLWSTLYIYLDTALQKLFGGAGIARRIRLWVG